MNSTVNAFTIEKGKAWEKSGWQIGESNISYHLHARHAPLSGSSDDAGVGF